MQVTWYNLYECIYFEEKKTRQRVGNHVKCMWTTQVKKQNMSTFSLHKYLILNLNNSTNNVYNIILENIEVRLFRKR